MNGPRDELRLLSIFHYVVAGLEGLFALFPLIHVAMGVLLVTGNLGERARPEPFGWILIAMGSVFILGGLAFAILTAVAGRFLGQARHHTFCLVVAAINCVFFPFGTALGVFTIISLQKPAIRWAFGLPVDAWGPPMPSADPPQSPSPSPPPSPPPEP
jgi:hypothetical protein